jgi:hypothetical protein
LIFVLKKKGELMLDKWWEKLYPHIFKKPCKVCLVQATCIRPDEPWKGNSCDLKNKWISIKYKVTNFLDTIEMWFFIGISFVVFLWIGVTFGFGIWKWIELIIGKRFFT